MSSRTLLITGASGGIGASVARRAVADGWQVALAARRAEELDRLVDELGDAVALAIPTDVTEWDQVTAMADTTRRRFGGIDAVFANAGFGARAGFLEESPEHWRAMILTNVYGAAITIRACVDDLRARAGHVVLTGSVAGTIHIPGSIYSSTKWAVTAMAEAARRELTAANVRVTLIAPGAVDTEFWENPPAWQMLSADDVADTVIYALSRPSHVAINSVVMRPRAQEM